jgi:HK97 family phage portal protein
MAGIFGRIFGRQAPEVKESATGRVMVVTPGQPVWSDRSYKAFSEEAYRRNVIAFRSIQAVADAVASVPWTAWRANQELETHPILDLINNPNPRDSKSQYLHQKVGFLFLSGNSYEEHVEQSGAIRELYQLRPDRMKIIPGPYGFAQGYEYTVGQRKVRFEVDPVTLRGPVRHLKLFNPTDDWYGLSPIEAGAYAVDTHNAAGAWMQSLLQNSARPSGALVVKDDKTLGDDEFNRLKTQLDDQYSGAANAGRPMLLEGGLDWKEMGLSPSDMALIETKLSSARDVALAIGVPPQLLGIPGDNTYSNYQEARLAFWEDTVMPLVNMIADDWNASLGEAFGGVMLKPDFDQIPAIVEKKRAQWDMLDKTTSLTLNEKREAMGYEPVDGGDEILVPMSQISLAAASERIPGTNAALSELSAEDVKAMAYGMDAKVLPLKGVK